MVIGLLAVTAIPTIIGVGNSISAQQKQNAMMSKEQEKFHLTAMLPTGEGELREAAFCVLVDGQVGSVCPETAAPCPVIQHGDDNLSARFISTSHRGRFKAIGSAGTILRTPAKTSTGAW